MRLPWNFLPGVSNHDPGHGEEPDAVQALKDFPVPVEGHLEEGLGVAAEAEPEKKFAWNVNRTADPLQASTTT